MLMHDMNFKLKMISRKFKKFCFNHLSFLSIVICDFNRYVNNVNQFRINYIIYQTQAKFFLVVVF